MHALEGSTHVDLEEQLQQIDQCFNQSTNITVGHTLQALEKVDTVWSRQCIASIVSMDRDVLDIWYQLTDKASRSTLSEVLNFEYNANMVSYSCVLCVCIVYI